MDDYPLGFDIDDGGAAHEPLACVGEHFPASWERAPSWFGPTDAASYAHIHRAIAARPRPVGLVTLEVR